MTFEQILDAAVELLRRKQRLTYGALKRHFEIDDATLEDLKQELILGQRVARDEGGVVIVWTHQPDSPVAPRGQAERRQLTILFCDLADSTALSNTLDPEDMRTVLRSFQDTAGRIVHRHDGFINSYLGDGIVVFYGYPQAHEDDAKRAVRSGLEIVAAVAALQPLPGLQLRVRVGIATGVVVVGDVIGQGASREEAVVGSTSNLAARLQALALPGEVVIGPGTRKLLGGGFDIIDLGPQPLKGFAEPVPAWRVVGERSLESLTLDNGAVQLPPMVDREVEFPAVMQCWRTACTGQGRVVTLRGEAGLGKSRLCEAVREAAAAQDHTLLRAYCSTRFQNTALYPVIQLLQQAAHFTEDDTDATRLDKLEALLLPLLPPSELAGLMPYYAALLGVSAGQRYAAIVDSPERQRELTLAALEKHLLILGRERPVLLIFEDLHWVDPTTLSLLDRLVRRVADVPLMVLATSRPEFDPPWGELPHGLTLELSLLKNHHRERIIEHHAGGKGLPPEILDHILRKSDGIPLYVEEITKAMIESGLLREEGERYVLTGALRGLSVPSTLHDSLLARLDRLSVVKEVAQAGAAIGREFSYKMLSALLNVPESELNGSLGRLAEAGLIHARGLPPEAVYTFKHALIQDAAYDTMLRPHRQGLQARIAAILEADQAAVQRAPELLAHHLIEADQIERAVPYLLAAGLQASAGAAHTEACKHFQDGLALLEQLPAGPARQMHELRLRLHLGMSLAATLGFAAPEVEACNQRARAICRDLGDTDELFWVLRGLCALYIVRLDMVTAGELADQLVRLGEETQRPDHRIEAYLMRGYHSTYIGEIAVGRDALERVVALYQAHDGQAITWPTPQDPVVAAHALLGAVCWLQGDVAASNHHATQCLAAAEHTRKPFDVAYAAVHAACVANLRGDGPRAATMAAQAVEVAQRHGFAVWLAAGYMNLGFAKGLLSDPAEAEQGIGLLEATLPAWRASGAELNSGYFLIGLAHARRSAGRAAEALQAIEESIAHDDEFNEHYYDGLKLRLRGELKAATDPEAARADYRAALAVAQRQGTALLALQAALAWARDPGHAAAEAQAALRAALAAAPGAAETASYREAQALLAAAPA